MLALEEKKSLTLRALRDAKEAVDFRRRSLSSAFRKAVNRRLSVKLDKATERELIEALIPFFVEQGRSMARKLEGMGGTKSGGHAGHGGQHAGHGGGGEEAGEYRRMPDGGIEWVPSSGEGDTSRDEGIAPPGRSSGIYESTNPSLRAAAEKAGLKEFRVIEGAEYDHLVGNSKGDKYMSVAYATEDGQVFMREQGEGASDAMREMAHHELAHILDRPGEDGKYVVSESKEWLQATGWKKSGKNYKHSGKIDDVNPASDYARTAPWEDFAETVRAYTSSDRMERRVLEEYSPKRYEFVKSFLEGKNVKSRRVDRRGTEEGGGEDTSERPDVSARWSHGRLGRGPREGGVQGEMGTESGEEERRVKILEQKHLPGQHDQGTHGSGGGGGEEPLARPPVILGGHLPGSSREEISDYLEANGKEWEASELPDGIERGPKKECFTNATELVLFGGEGELDYVEGIAYDDELGPELGFLHAWAVTKEGKVVDNTWDEPEKNRYFGVKYDKEKYRSHLLETGMYGVLGGEPSAARKVLKEGGL